MAALAYIRRLNGRGNPEPPPFEPSQLRRLGTAHALEPGYGSERSQDGESEADMQRAEAWRAEANVRRAGLGSHEPARFGMRR